MLNLEVHEFKNQKELDSFMDKLNERTKVIMNEAYNYYLKQLHNEQQKKIFHDWWYGKSVYTDEYRKGIDEDLLYEVDSCILEACSRGFG